MEEILNETAIIFRAHRQGSINSDHAVADVGICDFILSPEAEEGVLPLLHMLVFFSDELGIKCRCYISIDWRLGGHGLSFEVFLSLILFIFG